MTTQLRRPNKKTRIVKLLKDRRYHSEPEMRRAGGSRFGARLTELRKDGYQFVLKRDAEHQSLFWYRLVAKPAGV